MLLSDLFESERAHKRYSDDELDMLFKLIVKHKMDKTDIDALVNQLGENDKWERTKGAAHTALHRMHVIVHQEVASGVGSGGWFEPSGVLDRYMTRKHYDVPKAVAAAKSAMSNRKAKPTEAEATNMMADYVKSKNLDTATRKTVLWPNRDAIVKSIMSGLTAKEAVDRFL